MSICKATIETCHKVGVSEYCVCAGSRNSELVRSLIAAGVKIWHFFEERSAAFFALGRCRATERPVAVITTSGTAAAELFPAVIEAHYQGLPLLLVTADRPRRFRGSGAPQAIEQVRLFGDYPQHQVDVASLSEAQDALDGWHLSGPAHINVCLEEPGMVVAPCDLRAVNFPSRKASNSNGSIELQDVDLVLVGDLLQSEQILVQKLLHAWQGPVWAEAASGLRAWFGERLLTGGDASLRHLPVTNVLRLGGVPSCRFWRDLETRKDIKVISASRSGHSGQARNSTVVSLHDLAPLHGGRVLKGIDVADLADAHPLSECGHLRSLSKQIPPQSSMFLGNSLTIRQWNLAAIPAAAETHCHVMRGANGIDGNLSFFLGACAEATESWAIVGDLTALYDLAAPWILQQLPNSHRRRIVVMNNQGGLIFRRLPSLKSMTSNEQEVIENPHLLRLAHWAAMWGMKHVTVQSPSDWEQAWPDGDLVMEVLPDSAQSEAFWNAVAHREQQLPT